MATYNPNQWLAIEVANQYGYKGSFEQKLNWTKERLYRLNRYKAKAKEPVAFVKAVNALREGLLGNVVHSPVSLDASASGLQIMSAVSRDIEAMKLTNLLGEEVVDPYQVIADAMKVSRKEAKTAAMTYAYGSYKVPESLFGEEGMYTFEKVMHATFEGTCILKTALIRGWDSNKATYGYVLPDNHYVSIPVLNQESESLEYKDVFTTLKIYRKGRKEKSLEMAANVIHSLDSYVARTMIRRLNYNKGNMECYLDVLTTHAIALRMGVEAQPAKILHPWIKLYRATDVADTAILNYLSSDSIKELPLCLTERLIDIVKRILSHKPMDIMVIHDDFRVLPSNCNRVLEEYAHVLGELSDSTTINSICKSLGIQYQVRSEKVGHLIAQSKHALG